MATLPSAQSSPFGGDVRAPADPIYGVTIQGGTTNNGGVYLVKPSGSHGWREQWLYSFTNGADGGGPVGPLAIGDDGSLFGVTTQGGPNNNGVAFRLTPANAKQTRWKFHVIHTLTDAAKDGKTPVSGLVAGSNGALYGTTSFGGACDAIATGCGVVFELTPIPGAARYKEKVLHVFTGGADGAWPHSRLTVDKNNKDTLYGTTEYGGAATAFAGFGTVFMLTH